MLQVQKFLFDNNMDWSLLEARGIEIRDYPEFKTKVLNYSQIDACKDDPIACECRALKLHYDGSLISRSFFRFFNYGEMGTDQFDFSNCVVMEKLDGSLCMVYQHPETNKWEISTRGTAFAEANHVFGTKTDWTFREAILDAMGFTEEQFQEKMSVLNGVGTSFAMEYCSPLNKIVTKYDEPFMALTGIFRHSDNKEITFNEMYMQSLVDPASSGWHVAINDILDMFQRMGMNIRLPKFYTASSGDELVAMAEGLQNLEEGFVVYDKNTGNRVKIKSSLYCAVHHLRGNGTPTASRLMEVVLKNETKELLTYFPEFQVFIDPILDAMTLLGNESYDLYFKQHHHESQKDFALAVKDYRCAPIMFKARKDKVEPMAAFESMELNQQMKILEKYL